MGKMLVHCELISTQITKIAPSLTFCWSTRHEVTSSLFLDQFPTVYALFISFCFFEPIEFFGRSLTATIKPFLMLSFTQLMYRQLMWAVRFWTFSPSLHLRNQPNPSTLADGFPPTWYIEGSSGDYPLCEGILRFLIANSIDIFHLYGKVAIRFGTDKIRNLSLSIINDKWYVFKKAVLMISMSAGESFTLIWFCFLKTYVAYKWIF